MAIHGRGFPIRTHLPGPVITQGLGTGGGSVGPVETVSGATSSAMTIPMKQGYAYAICWAQTDGTVLYPTLTDPDSLGNSWTRRITTNPSHLAAIFTVISGYTGSSTVTVNTGLSTSWKWQYIEVAPSSPGRVLNVGPDYSANHTGATTSHYCATGTSLDTLIQSTLIGCSAVTTASGGFTASAGYTKQSGTETLIFTCSGYFSAALVDERIPFTTGSSVNCNACCVFFYEKLEDARVWAGSGMDAYQDRLQRQRTSVIAY